jgi:hypothetical protein
MRQGNGFPRTGRSARSERELVLRLASLLWRLRRATAIETDLLRIQAEILSERRMSRLKTQPRAPYNTPSQQNSSLDINRQSRESGLTQITGDPPRYDSCAVISHPPSARDLSLSFQRLINLDSVVFERLGRYEAALARQAAHCMFFLRSARYR